MLFVASAVAKLHFMQQMIDGKQYSSSSSSKMEA
jgi:hypothetical protein